MGPYTAGASGRNQREAKAIWTRALGRSAIESVGCLRKEEDHYFISYFGSWDVRGTAKMADSSTVKTYKYRQEISQVSFRLLFCLNPYPERR